MFLFCFRLGKKLARVTSEKKWAGVTDVRFDESENKIKFQTRDGQEESVPRAKIKEIVAGDNVYDFKAADADSIWNDIFPGRTDQISSITKEGWTILFSMKTFWERLITSRHFAYDIGSAA